MWRLALEPEKPVPDNALIPHYRRAPEHVHPAPVDDAVTASAVNPGGGAIKKFGINPTHRRRKPAMALFPR